jgi:hypothetical protein
MKRLEILFLVTAIGLIICSPKVSLAQDPNGKPPPDLSKPVPAKSEVIKAWQKRQDAIKTFRFAWTEQQTRPKGWLPNPRYPEREWLLIPGLLMDRSFTVSKMLAVDGNKMRYTFEIDRKVQLDGSEVTSPRGDIDGFGVKRHYLYVSLFDGQAGKTGLTTLTGTTPPSMRPIAWNVDAQNLDTRAILMMFRPLDPVMGDLLIDRAISADTRDFYKGRSTFLLPERADPSGWKTVVRIDPERDFLVCRIVVQFEGKWLVDVDIDHVEDKRWGWIPSGWRVTEILADGSRRVVVVAKVSSFSINQPIGIEEFK